MNPSTGHLVSSIEMVSAGQRSSYEPVPPELARAAQMKLAGERVNGFSEAFVSLTSGGKLSRWAAGKRKVRNRMAKESRRKNRGR